MEIYVLDKDINILGVFTTYEAIIWNPKLHEPGTFKASFIFTKHMNEILKRGNFVFKTDEDEPAIITRKFLKLNKRGEQTIQVQGYMASRYLNQRIIWNKMLLKGTYEEVMRQMVLEQVIEPNDAERRIARIELGELKGYEGAIEKQIAHDNLQVALTDLAKVSELGYRLRLDMAERKFFFEVYQGVDRTAGTDSPCIFTRDYGNVYTQDYSEDDSNYRNVCLVGGVGEDENRIYTTVGTAAGTERYEMFYNAAALSNQNITAEAYLNQLAQKGKEQLAKYYIATAFESKINQRKAMPFALGDYVTCVDSEWNITINTQIKAIEKGITKEEELFVVTFGNDVPTLIDLIKAKE